MRLRRAAKPPTFALPLAARTRHAWLARLTRARRQWFGRRTARVLLADFWYFSSRKSTIREKFLYDSSRANNVRPLYRRRQHTCFAYVLIPLPCGSSRRRPLQDKNPSIASSQNKNELSISSAHLLDSRPRHPFFSGRADNACTNLLGFLV